MLTVIFFFPPFHSMDKILEQYERYSYAEKVLISAESETQVNSLFFINIWNCFVTSLNTAGFIWFITIAF